MLLLKDPRWDNGKQWEAQNGLESGSLAGALFDSELDTAAILGHISQEELIQQASLLLGLPVERLHEFSEVMWSHRRLNNELATLLRSLRQ